ncbi:MULTISPECIES: lipid A export permease/ATP-binding protein MsbA [Spiribacter]|uniref:Lipid A export permease/ATP-binding protein MsbA n=2 Tax=Spiribacter TaxID=1335745 RepID=A0A557RJ18_9GAMM|nr:MULTISPECIES: lipid A export permease/ATP-binding protein MsbA [Spiribacter]KAF0280308.1 lipid A export permease/ATP-binding protein MsbA [Spiribacter roseus]KAF0283290.1 lipid A export permease/ATP-binding protein MsbA [Spiribacter roseus]TVO65157.1 lipid A export permease/ATP-binding protein MsbA [Spiribacter aquaticus]
MSATGPGSQSASGLQIYRRLISYVLIHWRVAALAVVGMLITGASEAGFAWLIKPMLDSGFVERDPATLRLIPLGVLGIFLVRGISSFAAQYGTAWVSRRVIAQLRGEVFARLLTLPRRYFDDVSSGMLLSRLTYNVEQVAQAGTNAMVIIIRDTATVVFLLAYMAWLSVSLTLTFMLLGPVVIGVVLYVSKRFRRLSHTIQQSVGSIAYVAEEAIEGSDEVRMHGAQAVERERFEAANRRNTEQFMKFASTQALSTPVVQFCAALALSIVVWLATLQGSVTTVSVGTFVSFITAMMLLLQPLKRLTRVHAEIQRGIAAGESIFEIIDEPPEPDTGGYAPARVEGSLCFDDVSFRYASGADSVLDGINLDIPAGETVAIVGRSGSGKTTLVNLLPRFYQPSAGEIRLDGVSLSDYRLDALRRQLALVGQQVVLFNTSVAENIAYGQDPMPSRESIMAAAEAANARTFIEALPAGFDTLIGADGVQLSGGQRQRLAIARALLKDAPVLILDEATSALDSESEQHIQSALERLIRGRTTLVIAHRLSTIERADRIVVLDAGRVVEQGTHRELIARGGHYAALHRLQFRRETPPAADD